MTFAAFALSLSMSIAARQTPKTPTWYGPEVVTFVLQVAGNPYDPVENDVRVKFIDGKGKVEERIAYYDGEGQWGAVLVAQNPGPYKPVASRNGTPLVLDGELAIVPCDKKLPKGFIRRNEFHANRFRWDNGDAYYPVGHNLGWGGEGQPPLTETIAAMGANGENWTRIWACAWDGKNPWWPQDDQGLPGQLWTKALSNWDAIVGACDMAALPFQFVMFHHGAFSSKVDPNWPDHPWNAAKGGFLKDAADFFTDPEAKRRSKMWLRYAVARWAASPEVLSWELFNEVEWVDARYADRWADIVAWHKEMADYLRSIDPYQHLITTSSTLDHQELYAAMDYYQPHLYSETLVADIAAAKLPTDKPAFYGEFGPKKMPKGHEKTPLRDGLYAGMLSGQAGAAMFWAWDVVHDAKLESEFKTAAHVAQLSGIADHPFGRPVAVKATVGRALAMVDSDWATVRLTTANSGPLETAVAGLTLPDGTYAATIIDLDTDKAAQATVDVKGGTLTISMAGGPDAVLILTKKK